MIGRKSWDVKTSVPRPPQISDRTIQLYIIHGTYPTPPRIARFQPTCNPGCLLWDLTPGSFYHLIWAGPVIPTFWIQVICFLHDQMGSPITLEPKLFTCTTARPRYRQIPGQLFSGSLSADIPDLTVVW